MARKKKTIITSLSKEPDKKRLKSNDANATKSAAVDPRIPEFESFFANLPPVTNEWREANGVADKDTPTSLSRHMRNTIFVFSHKTKENGNALLAAYMHRLNKRQRFPTYDQRCKLVIEFDATNGDIVHKWTDWEPYAYQAYADIFHKWTDWEPYAYQAWDERTRPGIFVYVARCFLDGYTGKNGATKTIRLIDHYLDDKDSGSLTDIAKDYTHFLSEQDMQFPDISGWNCRECRRGEMSD